MNMRHRIFAAFLLTALPMQAFAKEAGQRPIAAATDKARVSPRDAGWQGATQTFAYVPGGLYQVYAAVGRVTDIKLQEGETLSDMGAVAAGDTVRWIIGEAASGSGSGKRTHILVKPTDPGIVTNLVINTNRRTYHVELRATPSTYMASVTWSYPQDELIAIQARAADAVAQEATPIANGLDAEKLNFAYKVTGDRPAWRPAQVFDDGKKSYILFPEAIGQSELPPLFLLGEKGQAELVNYRVSGRYMIVDRLFDRAELRLGTKKQQIVRIERQRPRGRV
jgi:P-type conjugative transfer protein TrbG